MRQALGEVGYLELIKMIVVSVAISVLASCGKNTDLDDRNIPAYADEPIYKIGTIFSPKIYKNAFIENHTEKDEYVEKYKFQTVRIGNLKLKSGQLVITEPLVLYDQKPIEINIKPGDYSVLLAEALVYKDDKVVDKRNAFAKIILNHGEATSWEFIGSFGVDGGTGGYIDYQVLRKIVNDDKSEYFSDLLLSKFGALDEIEEPFDMNHDSYMQYVELTYGDGNLLAFSTGWGDGGYNSYIGYDSGGDAVEVLTDLGIISWDDKQSLRSLGDGKSKYSSSN